MLGDADIFSSFAVNDVERARQFYSETLGLDVVEVELGTDVPSGLEIHLDDKAGSSSIPRTITFPPNTRSSTSGWRTSTGRSMSCPHGVWSSSTTTRHLAPTRRESTALPRCGRWPGSATQPETSSR